MLSSPSALSYGGRCARCSGRRRHALPMTPDAVAAAIALREQLEKHGRLDFDRPDDASNTLSSSPPSSPSPPPLSLLSPGTEDGLSSSSPSFSTRPLLPRSQGGNGGPGRMLGVALCEPGGVVLRAFSGQLPLSDDSDGAGGGGWACPGWAGPVGALNNGAPEYARYRRLSDALTRRIGALLAQGDGQEAPLVAAAAAARLRARRRAVSHALIARVQESYSSRDLLGRPVTLREAYLALADAALSSSSGSSSGGGEGEDGDDIGDEAAFRLPVTRLSGVRGGADDGGGGGCWRGFRAGVGDCCAPKLIHEAALRGLRPVAMAEFWFGAPPDGDGGGDGGGQDGGGDADADADGEGGAAREGESKEAAWQRRQRRRVLRQKQGRRRAGSAALASREHGRFYGPCEKCAGILGAMLCDVV